MKHEWMSVGWTRAKVCKHCGARCAVKNGVQVYAAPTSQNGGEPVWETKKPRCKQ